MSLSLYSYFRSSAAYRVRIALNLKALPHSILPVHLVRNGGEQLSAAFVSINPQALLPVLEDGDLHISQSLAILEYLEETAPTPPLLPKAAADRARVRQLALAICCEIHPLNNLRVLRFLTGELGLDAAAKDRWIRHWLEQGLAALEVEIASGPAGVFCFGDTPTLADCCLIPQLFNARRSQLDLTPYPRLIAIENACNNLPAFHAAHPAQQIDAE
ncbi:maleylacetoacetate isomerase [Herbaspirillum sp. RTI4]|uniref:maleylacetoacetate isomerase n=1 Tax=Herbaspirillum sp. RTI4 TaxID=3048640 RepID=UPI002AB44090|nr:maleylacetoacetate isomerase [Herbaspirillum sp. RTI4]MDY7577799.1 maleylacetoacetate isomerase [Herbaspirillum sp. RTI4]MEA9980773.1 maleylacetoacetate isomerase [Herbaspirillum sp. RTI4]